MATITRWNSLERRLTGLLETRRELPERPKRLDDPAHLPGLARPLVEAPTRTTSATFGFDEAANLLGLDAEEQTPTRRPPASSDLRGIARALRAAPVLRTPECERATPCAEGPGASVSGEAPSLADSRLRPDRSTTARPSNMAIAAGLASKGATKRTRRTSHAPPTAARQASGSGLSSATPTTATSRVWIQVVRTTRRITPCGSTAPASFPSSEHGGLACSSSGQRSQSPPAYAPDWIVPLHRPARRSCACRERTGSFRTMPDPSSMTNLSFCVISCTSAEREGAWEAFARLRRGSQAAFRADGGRPGLLR